MNQLRILHAVEKNTLTTGSVVQMMEAARELVRRGHAVVVAAPPGGDLEQASADAGASFEAIGFRRSIDPLSIVTLRRLLQAWRPQVVHVHKGRAHAAALIAASGLGPWPRLVVNRGVTFSLDVFNRLKYHHSRVAKIVCVAEAVRQQALETGRLHPEQAVTIHAGTDHHRFDPARIDRQVVRAELDLQADALLVGLVSLRSWKGWTDLVAAAATIAPSSPRLRLLLVGGNRADDQAEVAGVINFMGLAEKFRLLPYRQDMPEILAACDVVVDASWAGTGITGTVREAMALERAVIATDCGGNRELVVDGESGLVVPTSEPDALAAAMTRLLEDDELRARLGRAARQRVLEGFTTEHRIDRLEALYRQICSSPQ